MLAAAQRPYAAAAFAAAPSDPAAWKTLPCWYLLGTQDRAIPPALQHYPNGLLTMTVSLEAIFLSTFVMISQHRADEKRQVLTDHQWQTIQEEERQNQNDTEQAASSSVRNAMGK